MAVITLSSDSHQRISFSCLTPVTADFWVTDGVAAQHKPPTKLGILSRSEQGGLVNCSALEVGVDAGCVCWWCKCKQSRCKCKCKPGDPQVMEHLAEAQLLHPSESRLHIGINVLKTRIFLIRGLKISLLWRFRNTSSHEMCRWSVFST